ncbi:MAG: hypothetical protein Q9214_001906, partial [Letrouitia sp. 1 TL-2023]
LVSNHNSFGIPLRYRLIDSHHYIPRRHCITPQLIASIVSSFRAFKKSNLSTLTTPAFVIMSSTTIISAPGAVFWEESRPPTQAETRAYHRNMRVLYQRALQKKEQVINKEFIQRGRDPALFQVWYEEMAEGIVLLSEEYENMDDVWVDEKDKRFLGKIATYWRKFLTTEYGSTAQYFSDYVEVWSFVAETTYNLNLE